MSHFLRKATCGDLPAIYIFEMAYIREIEPEMEARWMQVIALNLRQWVGNLPRMVVAVDGDRILGHSFWERDAGLMETAGVSSLYVVPAARRQGIGWELLRWCEQDAIVGGIREMRFGVKRHNPARLLYERAGYRFSGESGGYDLYEKSLTGYASQHEARSAKRDSEA